MNEAQAKLILREARRDPRLSAEIISDHRGFRCYSVKLMLRRWRSVTLVRYEDWPAVQAAWAEL